MESTLLSLLLALFSLEGITIRSFIGGGIFALPSYRCLRSKPSPQCTVDTFNSRAPEHNAADIFAVIM
jgi:hypothetical protein